MIYQSLGDISYLLTDILLFQLEQDARWWSAELFTGIIAQNCGRYLLRFMAIWSHCWLSVTDSVWPDLANFRHLRNFFSVRPFLDDLLSIWQNVLPALVNMLFCFWDKVLCCKWANFEQIKFPIWSHWWPYLKPQKWILNGEKVFKNFFLSRYCWLMQLVHKCHWTAFLQVLISSQY